MNKIMIEEISNGIIISNESNNVDISKRQKIYCKTLKEVFETLEDMFKEY